MACRCHAALLATGMPFVRLHKPWPAARTSYSACDVLLKNNE
jgi:hypothetical protein